MSGAISDRQLELLRYIADYRSKHAFGPTIREMQEHLGVKSHTIIFRNLGLLKERGLVVREIATWRAVDLSDHARTMLGDLLADGKAAKAR